MLTYGTEYAMSDLAEFLTRELAQISYRELESKTGVSRGALEAIVKREGKKLPQLETLTRIAKAYNKPLWEVVQMAGADLELPANDTNRARRLAQLVDHYPQFEALARRLLAKMESNPDFVDGMIIGIEAAFPDTPAE